MTDPATTAQAVSDALADRFAETVLTHEGGLEDNPDDPGGLTNWGFALRDNPDLTAAQIRAMTRDQAKARYIARWWAPMRWRELPPDVAVKAADAAVNMGAVWATKALQRAVRACGNAILDDGLLGSGTVAAANQADAPSLMTALRSELAGHYRLIAETRPSSAQFLTGWLNRAYG